MQTIENATPKISYGNKKLPKTTAIFNIPAVKTCPMRTELCSKACYALKAERMYKQVLPARKHNLKLALSDGFVDSMIEAIAKKKHKIKQVRIHESGDFYRQDYLDKWFLIASAFPEIIFYAYTKSFHLDFSDKPFNFVLIASFDQTSTEQAKEMYQAKRIYFNNSFSIVGKKEEATCIQDCTTCSLCWTGNNLKLTVNQH